ncbi:MAG: DUF1566 domain-containing protein [Nitrospinota bacterium]
MILFFGVVFLTIAVPESSWSNETIHCTPAPAYQAPPYVEPKKEPEISKLHLIDNGDETITDLDSGLLWTKKDSYADLGKCLNWQESLDYVEKLKTGGFDDWRVPTIKELSTLYDPTKENNMAWDHNPDYPLALDENFADGSAYWFWSSENKDIEKKRGCAKTLYFVKGLVHFRNLKQCNNGGVRGVRNMDLPIEIK